MKPSFYHLQNRFLAREMATSRDVRSTAKVSHHLPSLTTTCSQASIQNSELSDTARTSQRAVRSVISAARSVYAASHTTSLVNKHGITYAHAQQKIPPSGRGIPESQSAIPLSNTAAHFALLPGTFVQCNCLVTWAFRL
jgi:hypothetical protein